MKQASSLSQEDQVQDIVTFVLRTRVKLAIYLLLPERQRLIATTFGLWNYAFRSQVMEWLWDSESVPAELWKNRADLGSRSYSLPLKQQYAWQALFRTLAHGSPTFPSARVWDRIQLWTWISLRELACAARITKREAQILTCSRFELTWSNPSFYSTKEFIKVPIESCRWYLLCWCETVLRCTHCAKNSRTTVYTYAKATFSLFSETTDKLWSDGHTHLQFILYVESWDAWKSGL